MVCWWGWRVGKGGVESVLAVSWRLLTLITPHPPPPLAAPQQVLPPWPVPAIPAPSQPPQRPRAGHVQVNTYFNTVHVATRVHVRHGHRLVLIAFTPLSLIHLTACTPPLSRAHPIPPHAPLRSPSPQVRRAVPRGRPPHPHHPTAHVPQPPPRLASWLCKRRCGQRCAADVGRGRG